MDLRVAITGHRTLASFGAAEKAVDEAIDIILKVLPVAMRANYKLVAVSALADGPTGSSLIRYLHGSAVGWR